jgi:hypothetical protein
MYGWTDIWILSTSVAKDKVLEPATGPKQSSMSNNVNTAGEIWFARQSVENGASGGDTVILSAWFNLQT